MSTSPPSVRAPTSDASASPIPRPDPIQNSGIPPASSARLRPKSNTVHLEIWM
jgi:hypothetical protein